MTALAVNSALELCANMMRVTAGAGSPEKVVHQARDLVESFTEAAKSNTSGAYPCDPTAKSMRQIFELDYPKSDAERIIDSVVRASLRLAASRMLDQPNQIRAAQRELREALRDLGAT
jgi:hypothetical protein